MKTKVVLKDVGAKENDVKMRCPNIFPYTPKG
jgi:hypothetical protein